MLTTNLERKSLTLDSASINDEGLLAGYASVFGNVDAANEVVVKDSFKNLDEFVIDGFVAVNHEWDDIPIATIESAVMDDYGLKVVARFHSTEAAQAVRTMVLERLSRNKSVGLSIGYVVTEDYVEEGIRYLVRIKLYEFSVVTVPCNPAAQVTGAKSTRLADQSTDTLTVVADLVERVKGLAEIRKAQNRTPLGSKAVATLEATLSGLHSLMDELEALHSEAAAEPIKEQNEEPAKAEEIPACEIQEEVSADVNEALPELASEDELNLAYQRFLQLITEN